jgi:energy-coupling factor transport system ATP-binding protein
LTSNEAFDAISLFHPRFVSPSTKETASKRSETLLEIRGLEFAYEDDGKKRVLNGIDLEIRRGEFMALVGANAAGKTTLAKNMVGLLRSSKGRVSLEGEDIKKMSVNNIVNKVGYVFQRPECQFVRETVKDDVSFSVDLSKKLNPESERTAAALLERFDLKGHLNDPVDTLSRGQKRRLSIISMLTLGQRLLILDEPTTGQDWRATTTLMNLLKSLNKETCLTVMIITHDMRVVAEWVERVLVMRQGEIRFDGKARDLFANHGLLKEASLAVPPIVELSDLFSQNGAPLSAPYLSIEEFLDSAEFDT